VSDPIERVLGLVAEGRLTAEEAAPILDALSAGSGSGGREESGQAAGPSEPSVGEPATATRTGERSGARWARIMVMEGGRRVVDLRIPASLGRFALGRVPGLSSDQVTELQAAISSGVVGPLLEVEDPDGDGVKIVLE
jgi:hypothetical protein